MIKQILWGYTCFYCGGRGSPDHTRGHKENCPLHNSRITDKTSSESRRKK